jgi:hypothetical protein
VAKNFQKNFAILFQRNDNIATQNSLFLFHILPKFCIQRKTLSLSSYMDSLQYDSHPQLKVGFEVVKDNQVGHYYIWAPLYWTKQRGQV